MIVKNEGQTLERCLGSARPYVDEIVVVDTGSTDGTQDIARRYADRFEEIEWPNSFAAARNHSMDLGTGDFLMILDGDEYIQEAFHWKRIRRALRMPRLAAIQLPILSLLGEEHMVTGDRMMQERLFRNHPSIRYIGSVHNQIQENLKDYVRATGEQVITVEAEVIHTGYALDPEEMKGKYRPRLNLLLTEYHQPRSDLYRSYYGYQLGVVYFVLEDFEGAARIFDEINFDLLTPQNAFYSHFLAVQCALKLGKPEAALHHANGMLSLDRTEPIGYFSAGHALLRAGNPMDGMLMFLEAFKVSAAPGASPRFLLNPSSVFKVVARFCSHVGALKYAEAFEVLGSRDRYDGSAAHALATSLQADLARSGQELVMSNE
ncbi:MAG TPA: glycosyltransferase family 2 protein [Rhodothermales bacterium]|nr:glycosyltransferase family 2 protein [Rhodothermales bacterium]